MEKVVGSAVNKSPKVPSGDVRELQGNGSAPEPLSASMLSGLPSQAAHEYLKEENGIFSVSDQSECDPSILEALSGYSKAGGAQSEQRESVVRRVLDCVLQHEGLLDLTGCDPASVAALPNGLMARIRSGINSVNLPPGLTKLPSWLKYLGPIERVYASGLNGRRIYVPENVAAIHAPDNRVNAFVLHGQPAVVLDPHRHLTAMVDPSETFCWPPQLQDPDGLRPDKPDANLKLDNLNNVVPGLACVGLSCLALQGVKYGGSWENCLRGLRDHLDLNCGSPAALADHLSAEMQGMKDIRVRRENYTVTSAWPDFFLHQYDAMASGEVRRYVITTSVHAMALALVKAETRDGKPGMGVIFYDPNLTNTFVQYPPATREEISRLSLEKFVMAGAWKVYGFEMGLEVPNAASPFHAGTALVQDIGHLVENAAERREMTHFGDRNPSARLMLMSHANCRIDDEVAPCMVALRSTPREQRYSVLRAENSQGFPAIAQFYFYGNVEQIAVYANLIYQAASEGLIGSSEIADLLIANRAQSGKSAILIASDDVNTLQAIERACKRLSPFLIRADRQRVDRVIADARLLAKPPSDWGFNFL